jgi:hypothetical protein
MRLLELTGVPLSGAHAVVLGRSDIVGTPVLAMLRRQDATVTQCHSKTKNLIDIVSGPLFPLYTTHACIDFSMYFRFYLLVEYFLW